MSTISSNGTGGGNASAGASWAGGVAPVDGDKVNILSGDTITLDDTSRQWGDDTTTAINIKSGGILKASRSANSNLRCKGSLINESGGELDFGKDGDPIPSTYTATIQTNYSAAIANDKYTLTCSAGSKFFFQGAAITKNTLLDGAVTAGGTSAVVDDATGWRVGDEIVFSSTQAASVGVRAEKRTLLTVAGTTVTFAALTYDHADNCEVGNLSSNVTVTSHTTGSGKQGYCDFYVPTTAGRASIKYTTFSYLGQNNPACYFRAGSTTVSSLLAFENCSQYSSYATAGGYTFINSAVTETYTNLSFFNPDANNNSGNDVFFYGGSTNATMESPVFYGRVSGGGSHIGSGGSQGGVGITINNAKFLGAGQGVFLGPGFGFIINDSYFYGINGATIGGADTGDFILNRCRLGYGGIGTRSLNYIVYSGFAAISKTIFNDCYISYATSFVQGNQYQSSPSWKAIVSNKNVDPTLQEIYTPGGNFFRDNSTYKDGTSSLRFDRIASSTIPASLSFYIFAPTGKPVVVSGYLRKNTSYGSSTRPYVTLTGLGISTSTYTMTDTNDTWEQFVVYGTQNTGYDGMLILTVYFQSSAASASAWIDGVSAPVAAAVNSGDFGYWAAGQPVDVIASNFVSPADVWNVLTANTTLSGSHGLQANNTAIKADDASILRGIV